MQPPSPDRKSSYGNDKDKPAFQVELTPLAEDGMCDLSDLIFTGTKNLGQLPPIQHIRYECCLLCDTPLCPP